MSHDDPISKITDATSIDARLRAEKQEAGMEKIARRAAAQAESQQDIEMARSEMIFNPRAFNQKAQPMEKRMEQLLYAQQGKKTEEKERPTDESSVEKIAESYTKKNPELESRTLQSLLKDLSLDKSHDDILKKLMRVYTDHSLADEALDFLLEASSNNKEMQKMLLRAKMQLNAQFGREIQAGRNMGAEARLFAEKGLGKPTALRDLYREITGNPRTPQALFDELTKKFKFSDMKNIIDFILHSLGSDMKAKGPSISRAELQRLFEETRTMQAILSLFRFFHSRMKLIRGQFDRYDLALPRQVTFETLAKLLMKLLEERYPSSDKVLKLAFPLGIAEEFAAQIIIFTQYRDAMRNISPKLFKSERHRQEMLMTLIETLSDIEDELDKEEE